MKIRVQSAVRHSVDAPEPGADRGGGAGAVEPPGVEAVEAHPPESAEGVGAEPPDTPRPVAVFVTHGMGQQLPFGTLDQTAQGIKRAYNRLRGRADADEAVELDVVTARLGEVRTHRLEMTLPAEGGRTPPPVHIYEAYWAPLTEGKVTLRDVVRFLVRGAWNGLRKGVGQPLERYMFGHNAVHGVPVWTFLGLLVTALVLVSLAVLNLVVAAVVVEAGYDVLAAQASEPTVVVEASREALTVRRSGAGGSLVAPALTSIVAGYLVVTLLFAVPLVGAMLTAEPTYATSRVEGLRAGFLGVVQGLFGAWVLATLAVGPLTLSVLLTAAEPDGLPVGPFFWAFVLFFAAAVGGGAYSWSHGRQVATGYREHEWAHRRRRERGEDVPEFEKRPLSGWRERAITGALVGAVVSGIALLVVALASGGGALPDDGLPRTLAGPDDARRGWYALIRAQEFRLLVWLSLFGVTVVVRNLVVQYFGDVAAYVSSHALDRFAELRRAIRTEALDPLEAIYRATADEGGAPLYGGVIVVGHSLGSVVAYDALNRAISNAEAAGADARQDVVDRTRLLLTFGSPLDKTAYIFRAQNQSLSNVREALANAVQPLIVTEANRTFPWVNVHSSRDPIGSALDLYDPPVRKDDQRAAAAGVRETWASTPPDGGRSELDLLARTVEALCAADEAGGLDAAHCPRCVHDVADPGARIPLVAHSEHWETHVVFDVLLAAVLTPRPVEAHAAGAR